METTNHSLNDLFEQLGLPNGAHDIEQFVAEHRPLPDGLLLADAPFWTPAQGQFLKEAVSSDADWAPIVDDLNVLMHR